ncbi:Sodium/hydrogen exchanger [Pleurotus pulmonarius]
MIKINRGLGSEPATASAGFLDGAVIEEQITCLQVGPTSSTSEPKGSLFPSRDAPSPTNEPVAEEEEFYSSWSLFLVCVLLIISLWTSYYLQIKRIRAVHETLVSIFAGMAVGMVIRLVPGGGGMIREMLTFKHTIFFNLLLPPIILNSGYELKQENFFRNSGTILTFAFLGTFISAVGLGVLVYIYSFLGLESLELGLVECLIFGSTLSATDPVTILAIFNQYKVDPKLYSIIFGESLLNDAVSIVMYETLSHFHGSEFHLGSVFHSIGLFLVSFSVSLFIGVTFGLLTSLLLKHSHLRLYPHIETSLVALSAYTCYFFSNGLSMSNVSMSGIVALLFCGITLKHYAYHTMSRRTQRATKYIFRTLAGLSENFIFIYLGMALFTSAPQDAKVGTYIKPIFIVITTISVVFTRYAAVFPLAEAINFFHRHVRGQRSEELPHSYQMMLFWAGLRGAVGVALAAGFKGKNAGMLRTTVLVVVVLTVLMFGGTTAKMLEILGIRTGVEDEAATSSDDEDAGSGWLGGRRGRYGRYEDDEPSYLANGRGISTSRSYRGNRGRIGMYYPDQNGRHPYSNDYNYNYNHHLASQGQRGVPPSPLIPQGASPGIFSAASSDTDSEAGEVLPMAPTAGLGDASGSRAADVKVARADTDDRAEEGSGGMATHASAEWFQAIDERYLLPLFSNATASRTFHARRARRVSHQRTASGSVDVNAFGGGRDERSGDGGYASGPGTPMDSEDEGYEGARRGGAADTRSPMLRSGGIGDVSGGRAS